MVLGTVSTTSASIPLPGAPTAPSAPPPPPPRLVHRDPAYRFLDVFIGQAMVPLQHVITMLPWSCRLGPFYGGWSSSRHRRLAPSYLRYLSGMGVGVVVVNEECPTVADPPRPSCVRVSCLYLLRSTSRSKVRKTELANGARKADRKPPLCPSPTCCCSKMRLVLAAGVRLWDNSRNFILYLLKRRLCKSLNGMSVLICCRHTGPVHTTDRRRRWR